MENFRFRSINMLCFALAILCLLGGFSVRLFASESDARDRILHELETSFEEDFLTHWYPRVKDDENGGYWSDFDENWNRVGRQHKFVVSQARHLWVTSEVALFTGDQKYRELANHGFRYLRDQMWDKENGGFHSMLTARGRVIRNEGKSAYGNSFAIYGLSSYYKVSHDSGALELLKKTFHWLEKHSWDNEFGGYVDRLNTDGTWREKSPERMTSSAMNHVGLKDYNSSLHLLESLTSLYQVWPDELVRQRLSDMLGIVRDRFVDEKGYLRLYYYRDWTHLSNASKSRDYIIKNARYDHVSWGHDVETAFLMLEAAHSLGGADDEKTKRVAKKMLDHAFQTGWDFEKGGLYESGYYFSGANKSEVIAREKVWWIAAEGMNAFMLFSKLYPNESRYFEAFEKQWKYIQKYLIDHERGGWYSHGKDSSPRSTNASKSGIWKASYHEGRTYMNCIKMLRNESPDFFLESVQ